MPTPEEMRDEVAKWPGDAEVMLRILVAKHSGDVAGATAAVQEVAASSRWPSVLLVSADQTLAVLRVLDAAGVLKGGIAAWLEEAGALQLDEEFEVRRLLDGDTA
jgi:hypothetical protein